MSARLVANCQTESQCCSGMSATAGASGGSRTLHGGMTELMPKGTPECRKSKKSESGSDAMSDIACHKFRRNG